MPYTIIKGPKGYLNATIGRRRGDRRSYVASRHWEKDPEYATHFQVKDTDRVMAYLTRTYKLADECQPMQVPKRKTLGSQVPKLF